MIQYSTLRVALSTFLLAALGNIAAGAGIWNEVPRDALGVVVMHDISQVDGKAGQLLSTLQIPLPQPLAVVKAATGVDQGLDPQGDLLLAVLPGADASAPSQLAVWLPVTDYDGLVRSLKGVPRERITAVTIAGEDLLVARHGDWAVVVDPNERSRLERMLEASDTPTSPVPTAWRDWLNSNDVTLMVFQPGIRRVVSEAVAETPTGQTAEAPELAEHLNQSAAQKNRPKVRPQNLTGNPWQVAQTLAAAQLDGMPNLKRRLLEATAIGFAVRLDAAGNVATGVRIAWPEAAASTASNPGEAAPSLYDGGEFVVAGAGRVSRTWATAAAEPYAHIVAQDLGIDVQGKAKVAVENFRQSLVAAVDDATAFATLSRPGSNADGVYTNSHLVVRVGSAKTFMERVADAIKRWNELADHAQEELRLKFVAEPIQIAGRDATQYSADMTAALGGPAIPEVQQSMERLFGPGGKLRLLVVPIDDRTVLVAAATDEQAAKVVELVAKGGPARWDQEELQPANGLVADDAAWRVFISPHGYVRRQQREMEAIVGQAIGGPLVKDFPASPPVAVSGGETSEGIWIELTVPAATIQAFGTAAK